MIRTATLLVLLTCIFAGCTSRENVNVLASRPIPQEMGDIVAGLSISRTATFVERRSLEGERETFVFQYDGLSNPDYLQQFETELKSLGWTLKGKRPAKAPKDPSVQQEIVFERNSIEMSYWTFESYGQYLIGITLPKQERQG